VINPLSIERTSKRKVNANAIRIQPAHTTYCFIKFFQKIQGVPEHAAPKNSRMEFGRALIAQSTIRSNNVGDD
jgi:hypothetical protein